MIASSGIHMVLPLEIGLCVEDLNRSLAFYRDGLGFDFVSSIVTPAVSATESGFAESGYTVVRLQLPTGERLKLFSPDQTPEAARPTARPLARVGFAFLTLIVSDIEHELCLLASRNIKPRPPAAYPLRDNVHVALVDDPDGNVVELVEYNNLGDYRSDR